MDSRFLGACHDANMDQLRTVQGKNAAAFVGGGASSHDIVDQKDAQAAQVFLALKGATDIAVAFLERQTGLRQRCVTPLQALAVDRYVQAFFQGTGNFG